MSGSPGDSIPWISASQMREVDRLMIEGWKISLLQMMENAGLQLARLARRRFLDGDPRGKRIAVLAGKGGNGGGALAAARRLFNWGARSALFLSHAPEEFKHAPASQLCILEHGGIGAEFAALPRSEDRFDLVLDGLLGYSLNGAPRGRSAELIRWTRSQSAPVLSLDLPSGLPADSSEALEPSVRATATLTLALPKLSLRESDLCGELYLADIGVPPQLYSAPSLGLEIPPLFFEDEILRLR